MNLVFAEEREFTNKQQELIKGWNLVFLDCETGETAKHFVGNDDLKGFDPKLISKVVGKKLELSTTVKQFGDEKPRIVLQKMREVIA